jgi:argininosuccinate synthase
VDVGQGGEDLAVIRDRALACGATAAEVVDAREEFATGYCLPALRANALYMNRYPLVSALSRPLIVTQLARVARERGADAVAHGCTGKGNDQVRFEVGMASLAPEVEVLAPVRDSGMTRDKAIAFAEEKELPINVTSRSPYSIDQNLWGRSCETGHLEDIWEAPARRRVELHRGPGCAAGSRRARDQLRRRRPVAIDGRPLPPLAIITELNARAGAQGVGRVDMVEDRLVGIKSRGDLRGTRRHRPPRGALRARERVHGA